MINLKTLMQIEINVTQMKIFGTNRCDNISVPLKR